MTKTDEILHTIMRVRTMPRAGWLQKGSRKRSNETVEVSREAAVDVLEKYIGAQIHADGYFALRTLMSELADGEHDAVVCDECGGIYQHGWMEDGKCLYCFAIWGQNGP
ncbi:hypothetical protein MsAc7_17470 [Methanolapillus millepedarum]|uniref:Uncharacterized protein n=1 Tax=Methanolapillus millepedarum TaxID=3028296 RepID=A0AA96V440_9EURY|nr:hypothetical protein MsAc7_17470 [Methanosarcinaceae archaeon Ac7]